MNLFLLILFDEDREAVPSAAMWEYVEEQRWRRIAKDEMEIKIGDLKYRIIRRRSYELLDNDGGSKMVLQLDIKRIDDKEPLISESSGYGGPGTAPAAVYGERIPEDGSGREHDELLGNA